MATETVVLVLTDVEGSTRLWTDFPDAMTDVMARHHAIVHAAVAEHGGWRPVDQGEGDAVLAAFSSAAAAVEAVVAFQRDLAAEPWPDGIVVRDRVGVHVGEVTIRDGNLFGLTVARAARIRSLGAGGQVLLSATAADLVRDALPNGLVLTDLGEHRMKDLTRPERLWELSGEGLAAGFPPLASLDRARTNLPEQSTTFFGRDAEVAELSALVRQQRLTTIVAFGGMGKTRTALQVAAGVGDDFADGVWFVDLAAVTDADRIPEAIAAAVGGGQGVSALEPLVAWLQPLRLLLVLDNLEQLLPAAASIVDRIVSGAPDVRILATSREAVRIRGEHVYGLEPLPLPSADEDPATVGDSAAIALFLDRAAAVRRDVVLTPASAMAVVAICTRLEGLPLALELAAARLRAMSPEALLPRLEHALTVLTHGSRDLPVRQQTLRATIAWSVDALSAEERTVLLRLSVFPATFDLAAAQAVAGDDDLDVLDAVTGLVDRSVLRLHAGAGVAGEDRYDLLVSIRDFAREQLELQHGSDEAAAGHTAWVLRLSAELRRRSDDGDEQAILGFRAEVANIDAALLRLLDEGDAGIEDAKRLMVAARSTYLGFLPYVVLHQRLQRLPHPSFRGGPLDTEVIGLALTIGYFLELPEERRAWLDLGFRLCDTDPGADWSRAARMSFLMEESELLILARDFGSARAVTLRCLEEAHLLGAVDVEAAALNQLVDMTEYEGDPEQGLTWATRYVAFIEQHRIVVRRVYARLSIVHALLELGRVEEATEAWVTAAEYAETIGSPHTLCWLRTYEGLIELARGRIDAAIAAFDAADEHLRRYSVPEGHHVLRQARIGVSAARGEWAEVDRMLAELPAPSELGFPVSPLPLQVRELLARRPADRPT